MHTFLHIKFHTYCTCLRLHFHAQLPLHIHFHTNIHASVHFYTSAFTQILFTHSLPFIPLLHIQFHSNSPHSLQNSGPHDFNVCKLLTLQQATVSIFSLPPYCFQIVNSAGLWIIQNVRYIWIQEMRLLIDCSYKTLCHFILHSVRVFQCNVKKSIYPNSSLKLYARNAFWTRGVNRFLYVDDIMHAKLVRCFTSVHMHDSRQLYCRCRLVYIDTDYTTRLKK